MISPESKATIFKEKKKEKKNTSVSQPCQSSPISPVYTILSPQTAQRNLIKNIERKNRTKTFLQNSRNQKKK